jgi:hypothetical protein
VVLGSKQGLYGNGEVVPSFRTHIVNISPAIVDSERFKQERKLAGNVRRPVNLVAENGKRREKR